jgi:hypothetical protein
MLPGNGRLDGARIIGRKPLELMTMNHLAGNRSIAGAAASREYTPAYAGNGFGLGFAVGLDTADGQISGTPVSTAGLAPRARSSGSTRSIV